MKIESLDMDLIVPNKDQPRYRFDLDKLSELERSIERNGIIQPIVVKKTDIGYRIIAGERRWRAAMKLNMRYIPAIIREVEADEEMELAIVENLQREDLNPIEEAKAIKRYVDKTRCTQDDISKILGKSRSYVSNTMRLLNLPDYIIENIESGKVSSGHGRALLSISGESQKLLFEKVKSDGLSVRELERLVAEHKDDCEVIAKNKITRVVTKKRDIFSEDLEEKISSSTGMRVSIGRGRVQIHYSNNDDLERIARMLLGED